ncbi:MAG: AAA family ATPase [Coprococcus sp.]
MSDKKVIITLGRECGSGGHEIGEKLSKKLGIAFYDKNLIELAAKHSGFDLNVLGATDEKRTESFYFTICTDDCGSAVQGAERCDP